MRARAGIVAAFRVLIGAPAAMAEPRRPDDCCAINVQVVPGGSADGATPATRHDTPLEAPVAIAKLLADPIAGTTLPPSTRAARPFEADDLERPRSILGPELGRRATGDTAVEADRPRG